MALGKQAKILTQAQITRALDFVARTRRPVRNRVILLLSVKAGLRAKEIAMVSWAMLTDADGALADHLSLQNVASKGKKGGRVIKLHPELKAALAELAELEGMVGQVIKTERGKSTSAATVADMLSDWFKEMGLTGCSSHSGRRTFITAAAKKITQAKGSLRDVQLLAGHSSLATTQRYIESDSEARDAVIDLI